MPVALRKWLARSRDTFHWRSVFAGCSCPVLLSCCGGLRRTSHFARDGEHAERKQHVLDGLGQFLERFFQIGAS